MNGQNRQQDWGYTKSPRPPRQNPYDGEWNQTPADIAQEPWPPHPQGPPQYWQTGYQPQNPSQYQAQLRLPRGMAIASLVLGLLALFLAPFITGVLAVILGGVSIGRCNRGEAAGKGLAIAGVVIGIVSIVGWLALIAFLGPQLPDLGGN